MMDLQTISEEISRLETQKPSYGTCAKLADLYIVKENLMKKQGGSSSYANYERSRENYENYARNENYARGGGRGGNNGSYMYDDYGYDYKMMDDEMMGIAGRPPRMSMPAMR